MASRNDSEEMLKWRNDADNLLAIAKTQVAQAEKGRESGMHRIPVAVSDMRPLRHS